MEFIELNWLCKHMKKIRSSQAVMPSTELSKTFIKDSFSLWVLLIQREMSFNYISLLRWPIDDISDVPRFFRKKDEPLFFPTVISSGNVFSTVITSGNVFSTVITSGNVFPTVITSQNDCAWADATTCFIFYLFIY